MHSATKLLKLLENYMSFLKRINAHYKVEGYPYPTWKWFYRELQEEEVTTTYKASSPKLAGQSLGFALLKAYEGASLEEIRASGDIFVIRLGTITESKRPRDVYIHARAAGSDGAPDLPEDHNARFNNEFVVGIKDSFTKG
jgi:hypothetical protein